MITGLSKFAVVAFILATYLLDAEATANYFRAAQVMLVVLAAATIVLKGRITTEILLPWAAVLTGLAALSVMLAQGEVSMEFRTFVVNCGLALALVQLLRDERHVELALSTTGIAGFFAALSIAAQLDISSASATSIASSWSLRLGSDLPGSNPNIAAIYLAIGFCAALGRALVPESRTIFRIAWLGCVVVIGLAVSLTGSRKTLFYCLAAAVVLVGYFSVRLLPFLMGVAAAITWALLNVPWLYVIVGHRLLGEGNVQESDELRAQAVPIAIDAILHSPVGTGWGTSRHFLSGLDHTHSNYLEVMVSVGVIGLVVYYSAHVRILWASRRMGPSVAPTIVASVLGGLVIDVVQLTYLYKAPMLIFAIAVAAVHCTRKSSFLSTSPCLSGSRHVSSRICAVSGGEMPREPLAKVGPR